MIKIVEEIFMKSNFIVEKLTGDENLIIDDILLASRFNDSYFDFYVIWYVEREILNLQLVKEYSEGIMDKVTEKFTLPGIDKNISLLILTEKEDMANDRDEEFYKQLFDIEEDPYFFKKYVLYYSQQQKELINEAITSGDILDILDTLIVDKSLFKNFKDNIDLRAKLLYDILAKIYIKIPFMKLNIDKGSVTNLRENIENEISTEDWYSVKKILELDEKAIDMENLESILKDDEYGI